MSRVGIDASNIISGGGLTHLVEILNNVQIGKTNIDSIEVWASQNTLSYLPEKEKIILRHHPWLDQSLLKRGLWQRYKLTAVARDHYDLLFVPGGSYLGTFRPFVTMNRNLLPFDDEVRKRYGFSKQFLRLYLLEKMQSRTFRKSDGVIFLTQEALRLTEQKIGRAVENSRIIPHGISKKFYQLPREHDPIRLYSKQRPFRILYVSSVTVYKHQWKVIEAVNRLRNDGLPVVLDLVGPITTPQGKRLLNNAMEQYDPDREYVYFHGKKNHDELLDFYRQANLFVFASSCETFGQILLEAMASGLPISCSDRSGMPEVLKDCGLYFDPEDPSSIYKSMKQFISSVGLREKMSTAAYQEAKSYSWEQCAQNTFQFITEVYKQSTEE